MSEIAVIFFSKIKFLCAKKHMHIFNMPLIAVQSFKMIAWKSWEELITQFTTSYWNLTWKLSKSKMGNFAKNGFLAC